MATIDLERTLGIAPDALWNLVGDFAGVSEYIDLIQQSYLVDGDSSRRECVLPDGGILHETLTGKNDATRTVSYTITAGLPLAAHSASMQVLDAGDGRSTFRWLTDAKASDEAPDFPAAFEGMLTGEIDKMVQRWP